MRTFYLQQYEKEYILARDLVSTERNSLRQFSEYHDQNNVSVDSTNQKLVVKKNEVKDHPGLESIDNFPNRGLTFYSTELYAYWKNRPKVTKQSKEVSTMSNRPTFMTRREKIKEMIDECVNEDELVWIISTAEERLSSLNEMVGGESIDTTFHSINQKLSVNRTTVTKTKKRITPLRIG